MDHVTAATIIRAGFGESLVQLYTAPRPFWPVSVHCVSERDRWQPSRGTRQLNRINHRSWPALPKPIYMLTNRWWNKAHISTCSRAGGVMQSPFWRCITGEINGFKWQVICQTNWSPPSALRPASLIGDGCHPCAAASSNPAAGKDGTGSKFNFHLRRLLKYHDCSNPPCSTFI